jgi:SAM-dependent methyltransferase
MNINEMQKNWNELGKMDPLWAILAYPEKKGGKWDITEFFESGESEIARVMEHVDSLHVPLSRNRALDFGCGVGRVTQAFCRFFDQCCGIDVAPAMIELAEQYNRYGGRCHYYINTSNDLESFEGDSFDFVYSRLVLQHIEPEYSENYIRELFRVLAPGGLLVFQIPSEPNHDALPTAGFKAQIAIQDPPTTAEPGSQVTVQARVKNISGITWPALSQIKLGNHWLNNKENPLVHDDGRASLPRDLEPGEEIVLLLTITVPTELDDYILELDLVQETVAWFKNMGSRTTKLRFQPKGEKFQVTQVHPQALRDMISNIRYDLRSKLPRVGPGETGNFPRIEMYCMPRGKVLDLVDSCGGKVLDVQEDDAAGMGWLDFCYYVTKPQTR